MYAQKYGAWALITGAAMGLGAEFALQLAQKGMNIIAVDHNLAALKKTAHALQEQTSVQIRPIHLDLSSADFLEQLIAQIKDCEVGVLVNNAGISKIGYFTAQSPDFLATQLHINTKVVLLLSRHFAHQMQQRRKGAIIILSSGAGELSSAYNAAYSASKAFDLKLAESLWAELQPDGIDVLGFMPGPTRTPGYIAQGGDPQGALVISTQASVRQALKALGKYPNYVAGGIGGRLGHFILTRFFPVSLRIKIVSKQIQKMFHLP
ncbi:SDR family NAD(P)-dependent oxidoreductase [Aureispira anguillae]|uniref:SDR family NAD(P)-dependent oxidoreductase n=1 Tax=Aureispira anguillae TaxID=2864201 RepID=A0A915YJL8_9BACT|nr:SDR family NAD(P)-dependent oxidoreductase [Aureispira anguillae]BDS14224.1 SDR family NAD(P)-dependent oxidoreductase [Aureispira anguillae]